MREHLRPLLQKTLIKQQILGLFLTYICVKSPKNGELMMIQNKPMTSRALSKAYLYHCANRGMKLTHKDISKELGVSERTFCEWLRGTNQPMAMKAVLLLLSELDIDQVQNVLNETKSINEKVE